MADSPWIVDATAETFQSCLDRSTHLPVVIDFWAPWCAPCRALAPILEKLANEMAGKLLLVKVNTDEQPDLAAAFGVQALPTVCAVRRGRLVDQFMGLLPEDQLRAWVTPLLPTPAEDALAAAQSLMESDSAAARAKCEEAMQLDPKLWDAKILLAELLLQTGDAENAGRHLADLEARGFLEPEAQRLKAELEVRAMGQQVGDLAAIQQEAAAKPDDLDAQFRLAEALAAARQFEPALQTCLSLVQRDRKGFGEKARVLMLDVFRLLPDDSPLTTDYRRKLSQSLY